MIYIKYAYTGFDIALTNSDGLMTLENLQSFTKFNIELVSYKVDERCSLFNITYVNDAYLNEFQQEHTQEQYDELTNSNYLFADDTNWLYIPEGTYKYVMNDGETGLLKTGLENANNVYDNQNENKIYYKG